MAEYIEREAAIKRFNFAVLDCLGMEPTIRAGDIIKALESIPAADVVSRGAYDQTDWERCVALTQLKEIGKSFGERMDDVRPVVRGKWTKKHDDVCYWFECSVCGQRPPWNEWGTEWQSPFCPNCGADMREEQDGR